MYYSLVPVFFQALAAFCVFIQEEPFYTRMPPAQLQGRPEWDQAM